MRDTTRTAGAPPAEQGAKKEMSLEQQARATAGTLVLLGLALGIWVHPGFLGLSAFVGVGLIFAGLTDTCGLALALGHLPWNKGRTAGAKPADGEACAVRSTTPAP